MHLSRVTISNFRNFSDFDVELEGDVVIVGENRVGKSNFLYALRLLLDATLPDSARNLTRADFWSGLEGIAADTAITISVEIRDFEDDPDILALLTDFRLDDDPETVRLTYAFRPKPELEYAPATDADFEFLCFGGESEDKDFGHRLRRRLTMDLLPALRDAEGDLATWRRSPLRPLIEEAFRDVDPDELDDIADVIAKATNSLREFKSVEDLEKDIATLFKQLSGPKQDIQPRLGFTTSETARLYRNVRLLIDEGARAITDASLGSANLVFLTLKALQLSRLIEENERDHTLLAIEEPEAHLHPHLQRSVYRYLFEQRGADEGSRPLSMLLTTHSPHIASIAPLSSLVLLQDTEEEGTNGYSIASLRLSEDEEEDLSRYLDVTRAEMLFARGVLLVEGDAERFLVPAFAETLGVNLDHLGISVCSVAGTNFHPYAKFLAALHIPFAVVTDWDPTENGAPYGRSRTTRLAETISALRRDVIPGSALKKLTEEKDEYKYSEKCARVGMFLNDYTLEVDLFEEPFLEPIRDTLFEHPFSERTKKRISTWVSDPDSLDIERYLALIERIGKGRFAQRLATRIKGRTPPGYIKKAIEYVSSRV